MSQRFTHTQKKKKTGALSKEQDRKGTKTFTNFS